MKICIRCMNSFGRSSNKGKRINPSNRKPICYPVLCPSRMKKQANHLQMTILLMLLWISLSQEEVLPLRHQQQQQQQCSPTLSLCIDTTACLLTWMTYLLSQNPHEEKRVCFFKFFWKENPKWHTHTFLCSWSKQSMHNLMEAYPRLPSSWRRYPYYKTSSTRHFGNVTLLTKIA